MSFHFLSNCYRQHPNTFGSLTSSPCARESSRCVQHFQSLLLVEGPALSPWYLGRWENGCLRAKHNHHLYARSYQIKSAMLFCVALTAVVGPAPVLIVWLRYFRVAISRKWNISAAPEQWRLDYNSPVEVHYKRFVAREIVILGQHLVWYSIHF